MVGTQTKIALHEIRTDLTELRRRAERLKLELVASLVRMAILDVEAVIKDHGSTSRLDS
ncbi:MAG: hypothetical protein JWQ94_2253 [Tardiphaga sp.]|nr:hypothetical protein [Tardiphaga sp.]